MQWFGPYKIFKNYENGSMELQDFEGNIHSTQYNGNRLKLYKTWEQVFFSYSKMNTS